jgi:hypothetical protein
MEGGHKSPSYKPCYCGEECFMLDENTATDPCWGDVDAVDELGDSVFVHACAGHHELWVDSSVPVERNYRPEPTTEAGRSKPV